MKNLAGMMKQAQQMQSKMAEMQEALEAAEHEGSAGAGLVNVKLSGKGELKKVSIDPSLFSAEEKEVVEDLIVAAHADASARVAQMREEEMKELTGGLPLPDGFKMPF